MKKLLLTLSALALVASMALAVTQTGNLIITIISEEGQVLPGATVVISSNVLMGMRTQTTDANGKATFRLLPPGEYIAEVTMDGFKPTKKENIIIRIQKISKEEIRLQLGEASEFITVVDITPIVDTSSSTSSVEFDFQHYINHMPTYKHYTSVASMSPGAQTGNNPSLLGGGGASNLYMVDGVNTTDMTTQTWGGQFTIDTVQDMSMQLTGVQAEYGYLQGGLMNMVTKSGSNELHGTVRLELKRKGWNDLSYNGPTDTTGTQGGRGEDRWDISGGGPLYPNMIWWYVGYTKRQEERYYQRFLDPRDPEATGLTDAIWTYYGHFFNVKVTVQPTEDIKILGLYSEDPIELINVGSANYYGPRMLPSADTTQFQGGDKTYAMMSWVFAENAFIEARWNDTNSPLNVYPNADSDYVTEPATDDGIFFFSTDGWYWGSVPYNYTSKRDHDLIAFDLNYLLETDSLGEHDIKAGYEYLDGFPQSALGNYPGGSAIKTGDLSYNTFDDVAWLEKREIHNPLPIIGNHAYYNNFYIQDSAQVMDELTLNIGLRTEDVKGMNNHDDTIVHWTVGSRLAPRIGFAYDLGGNSLHGSYGRYYDMFDQYIISYFFNTFDYQQSTEYYKPADGLDGRNGWADTPYKTAYAGGTEIVNSVNPDLKSQYMDEFALGFDYLINNNTSIGILGIWRQYRDLICPNDLDYDGTYYVTNLETDAHGNLWKDYKAVIINFRKRPSDDNLFLAASFTYSDLTGLALSSTGSDSGQLFGTNLFLALPWYNPEDIEQWWGTMTAPSWNFKLQGTYFFPNGWYLGAELTWEAGFGATSRTTTEWDGAHGYGENAIGNTYSSWPNGSNDMDRLPDVVNLDLQFGIEQPIEFPFQVPFTDNGILIGIYANILNALNRQQATSVGTLTNVGTYGQYLAWTTARNYQIGFRIEL